MTEPISTDAAPVQPDLLAHKFKPHTEFPLDYVASPVYCRKCGWPVDYCKFGPTPIECGASSSAPVVGSGDGANHDKKSSSARICVTVVRKTGRRFITTVAGLQDFGIDPESAAGDLAKACASGVTSKSSDVEIQGDFGESISGILLKLYPDKIRKSKYIEIVKGK